MFKLLDRYIFKEISVPFFISLIVISSVLLMNQVLILIEIFITNRIPLKDALVLLLYLIPSILSVAAPMAVLIAILTGFSRMSSDKEIVALKILGTSYKRFLLPVFVFTLFGFLLTSISGLYAAPSAYSKWMRLLSNTVVSDIQLQIKPRFFNQIHPNLLLYYQGVSPERNWKNILIYSSESEEESQVIFAEGGMLKVFPEEKKVLLELSRGTIHSYPVSAQEKYRTLTFEHYQRELEVERFLPSIVNKRALKKKNINELFAGIKKNKKELLEIPLLEKDSSSYQSTQRRLKKHRIEIHKRFALSYACFVFAFLGFLLGVSSKRGGKMSVFAISFVVILVYYMLMTGGAQLAMETRFSSFLGIWGANILFSLIGIFLYFKQ